MGGVVNLVSAEAAQEVEDFLIVDHGPRPIWDEHDLTVTLNLFLTSYEEVYDFVYLFTDHELPTDFAGKFQAVSRPGQVGTGNEIQVAAEGYLTNGTIKGVMAFQYFAGRYGPLAHELIHYWANHFDPAFGFGEFMGDPHWGYAGVHGQLGGFDPATLFCETPAGASPPACTPGTNGRYRYVVSSFAPNANGPNISIAPLELYLMGVLPSSEVPSPISVLDDAIIDSFDEVTGTQVVDAAGMHSLELSEIIARHGEVPELPQEQRAFRAAFVVVSAAPTPDSVMLEIAHWAAVFGNREPDADLRPLEDLSGGRVTIDTRLGPQRSASQPPLQVRPPLDCDVLAQDCQPSTAGCYLATPRTICATSRGYQRDEPCQDAFDCAPGLECTTADGALESFCEPICEPIDDTSPIYCETLCSNFIILGTPEQGIISGRCFHE
jgi:hypothetical protein